MEINLFEQRESEFRLVRPHQPVAAVPAANVRPTVASSTKMAEILRNVVMKLYAPSDEAKRMELLRRSQLSKDDPEYLRSRLQYGSWPIADTVSAHLPYGHFALQVAARFDESAFGSHVSMIRRSQPHGDWVPVYLAIRDDTEYTLGGDPSKEGHEGLQPVENHDVQAECGKMTSPWDPDGEMTRYAPRVELREIMDYAVLYVDAKGRKDVRYDDHGKAIADVEVNIRQTSDPALAEAIRGQGEAIGMLAMSMSERAEPAPDGMAAQVAALMAEVRALREENAKASAKPATKQ